VMAVPMIATQLSADDRQHRAHPLTTARNQMAGKRRDQRYLALHPLKDDRINRIHPLRCQ